MKQKLDIIPSEAYSNFISSINSKYTKNAYISKLAKFMKFCGIYDLDTSKLLKYNNTELENNIRDLIVDMKNNNYTKGTISTTCAAIKHFYDMNDVYLKWKKLDKFKKGAKPTCIIITNENKDEIDKSKKDRAYTIEEIRKIYNSTRDQRVKVIASLMTSSGVRFGAFLYFRICDFIPIDKYQIYKIKVYAGEPEEYFLFVLLNVEEK